MQNKNKRDGECRTEIKKMGDVSLAAKWVERANARVHEAARRLIEFRQQAALDIELSETSMALPHAFDPADINFWHAFARLVKSEN